MKALIILGLFYICLTKKPKHYYSMSSSFSSFSSSSNEGGKPETHFKSMNTEEYRDKDGDKPEQIRKYGEMFSKDNDKPGVLKQKANTNVEEEGLILGNNSEETNFVHNPIDEKDFMKDFGFGDFHLEMTDSFFKDFFKESEHDENSLKMNHGKYDKFLDRRKKALMSNSDKN